MTRRPRSALKPFAELLGKRLATASVFYHAAAADRLGIGILDARCHSLLGQLGPMAAGDLAVHLGITTGAVTGVLDRLERARLVKRVVDRKDRRRVLVELARDRRRDEEVTRLYAPMGERMIALCAGYSDGERAKLGELLTRACEILEEETMRLRAR
jgi:DNA-binding MarR family transcriptional regulator